MKRLWLSGLCVCAGWFVGTAAGQENPWRTDSPRPLTIARTEGTPLDAPPRATLGRPLPLDPSVDAASRAGDQVVPTAFRPAVEQGTSPPQRARSLEGGPVAASEPSSSKPELTLPPVPQPVRANPLLAPAETPTVLPADGPTSGKKAAPETASTPRTSSPYSPGNPAMPAVPGTCFATDPECCSPPGALYLADCGANSCGADSCAACTPCPLWGSTPATGGRFYGSAEYLLWWIKGANAPPLVTTSPATAPQSTQGVLGQPGTVVLFGGSQITEQQNPFSGGRFFAGYQFGPCNLCAVEVGGFFLGRQTATFDANSPFPPVIARPFLANTPAGMMENAELVASPGSNPGDLFSSAGGIHVAAPTQFYGLEANLKRNICCGCNYRLDVLGGYRYLNLSEGLFITENLVALRAVPATGMGVGDRIMVTDRFNTRNRFNGGQLGLGGEYRFGRLFVGGSIKVALGDVHQVVNIHGGTQITPAAGGPPTTFTSGLLALSSNSGTFSRDTFAVVPEGTLKIGYQITDNLRAFVGYNFLYISSVVRPGDQIDRVLNTNLIPPFTPTGPAGPPRPLVPFKTTDFWAQGLTFGVEWRY
jgi:hypothetical protein